MRHAIVEEENIPFETVTNFDEVIVHCSKLVFSIQYIGCRVAHGGANHQEVDYMVEALKPHFPSLFRLCSLAQRSKVMTQKLHFEVCDTVLYCLINYVLTRQIKENLTPLSFLRFVLRSKRSCVIYVTHPQDWKIL